MLLNYIQTYAWVLLNTFTAQLVLEQPKYFNIQKITF